MAKANNISAWLDVIMQLILILFIATIMFFFIYTLFYMKNKDMDLPYSKYLGGSISLAGITGILRIYVTGFHTGKNKLNNDKKENDENSARI